MSRNCSPRAPAAKRGFSLRQISTIIDRTLDRSTMDFYNPNRVLGKVLCVTSRVECKEKVTTQVGSVMKPVARPDRKVSSLAKSLPHQVLEEVQSEYLSRYSWLNCFLESLCTTLQALLLQKVRKTYATDYAFQDGIPGRCCLFGVRVRSVTLYRYGISTHCISADSCISTHCKLGLWFRV